VEIIDLKLKNIFCISPNVILLLLLLKLNHIELLKMQYTGRDTYLQTVFFISLFSLMCWIVHFFKRFQLYSILVNAILIAFYIYFILCYYL